MFSLSFNRFRVAFFSITIIVAVATTMIERANMNITNDTRTTNERIADFSHSVMIVALVITLLATLSETYFQRRAREEAKALRAIEQQQMNDVLKDRHIPLDFSSPSNLLLPQLKELQGKKIHINSSIGCPDCTELAKEFDTLLKANEIRTNLNLNSIHAMRGIRIIYHAGQRTDAETFVKTFKPLGFDVEVEADSNKSDFLILFVGMNPKRL